MIQFDNFYNVPKDFTGVCRIEYDYSVRHFVKGKHHNENGFAIEFYNGDKTWYINGKVHNENGPAVLNKNGIEWWYKDKFYGYDNSFTNETWKEKVEDLKHEEELKIFI